MSNKLFVGGQERLSTRAYNLKRAWLMATAWAGVRLSKHELVVPNYSSWSRRKLTTHVDDLELDFRDIARKIVKNPSLSQIHNLSVWLSSTFDQCINSNAPFSLCTAHYFESRFGLLRARDHIEVPPYAELLYQGWHGLSIRHPEYMIARDLEFLFSMHRETEKWLSAIDWAHAPKWARYAAENVQGLARSVILTCFSLLESFVSGLARAHVMLSSNITEADKKSLLDNKKPLKNRLLLVPAKICGSGVLSETTPTIIAMFGPIKRRRDSFVHCEPGPDPASHGYVKQAAFHDVSAIVVEEAITSTSDIIKKIWKSVHNSEGPRWLPDFQSEQINAQVLHLTRPE